VILAAPAAAGAFKAHIMLDSHLKQQLQGYLERISQPVEIVASLDDSEKSQEMLDLLEDIESVSSLVKIDAQRDDAAVKPSFALRRPGAAAQVRFAGVPMGHEFTSLVLALLQTGGYAPKIDEPIVEQIRNLDGDYNFETFVSLTCQSCPDVVQALNAMAALNPRIRHTMIDGAVFQDEVAPRGDGGAGGVPERPAVRTGPHGARGDHPQVGFGRGQTRIGETQRQGAL
jgi:alkyl hydroperoxide reductase subunit F